MTAIATTTTALQHRVRLVHGATGEAILGVRIAPLDWPTGWSGRVVSGAVVVVAEVDADGDPLVSGPGRIDVLVTDGILASVLDFPPLQPDQPPHSVRVPLTAAVIDVPVNPVALELVVTVHGDTAPSGGLVVKVRGASGSPTVPLTEGATGVYSASRVWGANLIDANLLVGATTVRKVSLDYTRATTRIHVVDPT